MCVTQVLLTGPEKRFDQPPNPPTMVFFRLQMCQEPTWELKWYDKVARLCCQTHWSSWSSFLRNESGINQKIFIASLPTVTALHHRYSIQSLPSPLPIYFALLNQTDSHRCLSKVVFIIHSTKPVLKSLSKIKSHIDLAPYTNWPFRSSATIPLVTGATKSWCLDII